MRTRKSKNLNEVRIDMMGAKRIDAIIEGGGLMRLALVMSLATALMVAMFLGMAHAATPGTVDACIDCHGTDPKTGQAPVESAERNNPLHAVVGSHTVHMTGDYVGQFTCSDCHVMPAVDPDDLQHRNAIIDMANPLKGGAYSLGDAVAQDNDITGAGLGNCSNTACHGASSPTWGTTAGVGNVCFTCHGNEANPNYAPETNAHQSHLQSLSNYSTDVSCSSCHTVPGSVDVTGADGHLDYDGTGADVLAALQYEGTVANTCDNASCHGVNLPAGVQGSDTTPDWTNSGYLNGTGADCGVCHTNPPTGSLVFDHAGVVAGTCTPCHSHSGTGSPAEHMDGTVQAAAGCTSCHTNQENTAHTTHLANTNYVSSCDTCHGTNASSGSHVGHYNNTPDGTTTFANNMTSYTNPNCTNSCHVGGTWDPSTGLGSLSCADCHDGGGALDQGVYPPTTAKHTVHINANTTYVPTDCDSCHGTNATAGNQTGHKNGTVDNTVSYTSGNQTCTNSCHIANTTGDWTSGGTLSCADCHDGGGTLDQGVYPPTTAKHTVHINANTTYVPTDCDSCHGANATTGGHTGHVNAVKTTTVSYVTGTQTCTNSCHIANTTGDWTSGGTLSCADCHDGGGTLDQGVYPPTTAKHTVHINANTAYVPTDCDSCHGANATTGGHTGHVNAVKTTTVSYVTGTQTCTNSCHIANTTGDWTTGGNLACLDCHTSSYIAATAGAMPVSGLHANITAGVTDHDATISGGCEACHTSAPSNAHVNGTTNTPATATFNFSSTGKTINLNALADNTDDTCAATCHTDGGAWTRLWSTKADSSATAINSDRCEVCHGDYGPGGAGDWRTGTVHATNPTRGGTGHAADCTVCHAYAHTNYGSSHENNVITMNSNGSSYSRNAGSAGCSACHGGPGDATHSFTASAWTNTPTVSGDPITGSGTCLSCHGGSYPPATNAHLVHATNLNVAEGLTNANSGDDATNWNATRHPICATCHDMSTSANHTDATEHIAPAAARSYDGGTPAYEADFSCSNINCHFGGTPAWK